MKRVVVCCARAPQAKTRAAKDSDTFSSTNTEFIYNQDMHRHAPGIQANAAVRVLAWRSMTQGSPRTQRARNVVRLSEDSCTMRFGKTRITRVSPGALLGDAMLRVGRVRDKTA